MIEIPKEEYGKLIERLLNGTKPKNRFIKIIDRIIIRAVLKDVGIIKLKGD